MYLGDDIVKMRGIGAATTWIPLNNKTVLNMFEVPVNVSIPLGKFIFEDGEESSQMAWLRYNNLRHNNLYSLIFLIY